MIQNKAPMEGLCLAATFGCALVTDLSSLQGADGGASLKDAGPDVVVKKCDPMAPFTTIEPLSGFDGASDDFRPALANDELTLWFSSNRDGGYYLYSATRGAIGEVFGGITRQKTLEDGRQVTDPAVSRDGLTLAFLRNTGGMTLPWDIFVATRATPRDAFANPALLSLLSSNQNEIAPTSSGADLFFVSDRTNAQYDLFVSRAGSPPVPVTELNTSAREFGGCLSEDGLVVYFSSARVDLGSRGKQDIFVATRSNPQSPFKNPRAVGELSSAGDERAGFLSADNCRLYFESDRRGTDDLWLAERVP